MMTTDSVYRFIRENLEYLFSWLFSCDMDSSWIKKYRINVVKSRADHECLLCKKTVASSEEIVSTTILDEDEGWGTRYVCLPCAFKELLESEGYYA